MSRTQIWSCGGGVQSTAVAALIVQGRLPKPDYAVIVDTTRERGSTWRYLEQVTAPALADVGVDLIRVNAAEYSDTNPFERGRLLIPAYVDSGSEHGGKLVNQCSTRWKRRALQRWARAQGVEQADVWLGISTDELRRIRLSREGWWQHIYPLIDLGLSRSDCLAMVQRMGWPTPPKSSCWMCPHMKDDEWDWQRKNAPEEWEKAVAFERDIQQTMPRAYLTRHMRPLSTIDLSTSERQMCLPSLNDGCDSGMCWV